MDNTYFISDTHFSHKNILKYEPIRIQALAKYMFNNKHYKHLFTTENEAEKFIISAIDGNSEQQGIVLEAHNNMIIDAWNSVVKPKDIVWFLGDLCLTAKEQITAIVSKLNGRKRMIRGNHDNWPDDFYRSIGFEYVSKYPVVLKQKIVLSHIPFPRELCANSDMFFVYGHTHSNESGLEDLPNTRCACLELNNFTPFRLKEYDNQQ